MVVARSATIAATGVKVPEELAGLADGPGLILLLDIHMKSIEMHFEGAAADSFHHFERLIACVYEVGFEAIEWFEANLPAILFRILAEGFQVSHHGFPLLLVLSRRHRISAAHGRINRADERRTVEHDHLVDEFEHVLQAG